MNVLVIEDEGAIRTLLADALAIDGHIVTPAADGAAALTLLRRGYRPDVVLTDVHMPIMDGPTFAHTYQTDRDLAPHAPIIVISADTFPERQANQQACAAVAQVGKPFDWSLLESMIRFFGERQRARLREREEACG